MAFSQTQFDGIRCLLVALHFPFLLLCAPLPSQGIANGAQSPTCESHQLHRLIWKSRWWRSVVPVTVTERAFTCT